VSDFPTTGMTLTRGDSRLISSMSSSRRLSRRFDEVQIKFEMKKRRDSRVTSRGDEVEENVYSVVTESRVALDTTFFGENVVVLSFEVTRDLGEAVWTFVASAQAEPETGAKNERTWHRCR